MLRYRYINKVILLIVSSFFTFSFNSSAGLFSSWRYWMKIDFSGYNKSEVLTNFPVLIAFVEGRNGFKHSQFILPQGGDLRFSTADENTELPYEIEKWDTNGTSLVWVRVNALSSNTYIKAYWGRGTILPPSYRTNGIVWANGYCGVWHLNNFDYRDSTSNNNFGVKCGDTGDTGDITVPGMTCQTDLPNGTAGMPINNNVSDELWGNSKSGDYYWQVDLGTGNARIVRAFGILPFGGTWGPRTFSFLGSTNGTNWITLLHRGIMRTCANSVWQRHIVSNEVAYRYYKFLFHDDWGSGVDVREIRLFETRVPPFIHGDGVVIYDNEDMTMPLMSCTTDMENGPANLAINNNTTDEVWSNGNPKYWQIDLGAGNFRVVRSFRLLPYGGSWSTKDFSLLGSTNGSEWSLLFSNQLLKANIWQGFTIPNTNAYRYYKFVLHNHYGSGHDIREIELYEKDTLPVTTGGESFNNGTEQMGWLNCGTSTTLTPTQQVTFSFWTFDTSGGWAGMGKDWSANVGFYYIPANIYFFINHYTNYVTTTYPRPTWKNVVGIYNGAEMQIYVDGVRKATKAFSGKITTSTRVFQIGAIAVEVDPYYMWGAIDEVQLSNVARSSNWVWAAYQNLACHTNFCSYGKAYSQGIGFVFMLK